MYGKKAKQNDARYQAAEQKIRTAFYDLIHGAGFQNTTVRMIVERAGINRSTFYLHYRDKYDLLATIEEELSGGIAQITIKIAPNGFDATLMPALSKEISRWVWENREWISLLDGPNGDPGFLPRHAERMRALMYGNRIKTVEQEYLEATLVGMVLSVIRTWIRRDFAESPEEFRQLLIKTAHGIWTQTGSIIASLQGPA